MTQTLNKPAGVRASRMHRAWWIATVAGLVIVVTGASTGMPDLLLGPLHHEFGWSRGTINLAFAVNMVLYGLSAPFAAALMDRFGMRSIVAAALTAIAAGAVHTNQTHTIWRGARNMKCLCRD